MKHSFETIERPDGRFVLVPEKHFETLLDNAEMQEDARAWDDAMARRHPGEEAFPLELGEKLGVAFDEGRSVIPVWREYRGMTQSALAVASGVNRPYLSEIESGKKPGSVDALKAIAKALAIDLDDLV